ncbi:hypothetical protein PN498_22505 [Oscillatoria sp. CS-180]|uniref:hypothetical protein n=1 Tax=Oscillatoria sp. CS-180 TaxID=3021720 RepID=UPI0023304B02|nr:hypothetical protein [Oscillatoria sp. CS-180]MDB9528781.1 hypothetical protein [Oscillatoria sp. CS-180]
MAGTEKLTPPVVGIQQATQNATNYLESLRSFMGGQICDIRLEEVELSEDERF